MKVGLIRSLFRAFDAFPPRSSKRFVSLPDESDAPVLPSSLALLNTAHEYLGRRSLCCSSDGTLLKFYV